MKKSFLLFLFSCSYAMALANFQSSLLNLQVGYIDPSITSTVPKTPIVPPFISLDDHTLYFDTPCDSCTLNIVDENDMVVYTLVIPTGTTSLVLPSTLSGEYELQIICGYYLFYGKIDLP